VFDSCGASFQANADHSRIAAVCKEGDARNIKIIDFATRSVISTLAAPNEGHIYHMRFMPDQQTFLFGILREDMQRFIFWNGRSEKLPAGDELMSDPLVLTNPERVGAIIGDVTKVYLYEAFSGTQRNENIYGYIQDLIMSRDGRHHAYIGVKPGDDERPQIVVDGHEGPLFDKIVSPVFSPDGRFLVYRARHAGKRFLVVSDLKGKVLRQYQNYDMVFQPVFTEDGSAVAYGALDGNELWWKVEKLPNEVR
ncbi:MAG: hypothetical protein WCP33_02465, partial [Deltaproteobacteria bacterium]